MCRENGYQHLYLSFSLSFASISLSVVPLPLFAFCHAANIVDLAIWIFGLIFVGFFFFLVVVVVVVGGGGGDLGRSNFEFFGLVVWAGVG